MSDTEETSFVITSAEGVPAKAKEFIEKALKKGVVVTFYGGVYTLRRKNHYFGDHEVFLYVLDGSRGGNLRAHLAGGVVQQRSKKIFARKRITKAEVYCWIGILGR